MSKTYRLKKWYPSLPKDWESGDIVKKEKKSGLYTNINKKSCTHLNYEVENKEFWEEVVEKDYEILKFKKSRTGVVTNSDWRPFGGEEWGIYSIRRLSDGEVFTVGDRIDSYCESGCITKFELTKNNVKVHFLDDKSTHQNEWTFLNNLIKAKEKLFTTEDGVSVYDMDEVYVVDRNTFVICKYTMSRDPERGCLYIPHSNMYFSTKKLANKWVDDNRPQYSKSDIEEMINKTKLPRSMKESFGNSYYIIDKEEFKFLLMKKT